MLESENKAILPDTHTGRRNDLEVYIIPNREDLEIKIAGIETTIKRKDLYNLAFIIGVPDEQLELMPVRSTTIRKYTKFVKAKARKDIKKGELIALTVDFDVPIEIYEGLRKDIFNKKVGDSRPLRASK